MSEENKALLRRWFEEVWNKGRPEAIDEMMAADCVIHGLSDDDVSPLQGTRGFHPFHETFRGAFPNVEVIVEEVIAEKDLVAARCSVRGTHEGDHLGIEASHEPVYFTGMVFARVKDAKFIEAWNNFDFLKMNKQIGLK